MSKSKDPLYKIKNLTTMAKHLGKDVARHRSIPITKMKEYITPREIKSIIKIYAVQDDHGDLLVNNKILQEICNEVDGWVLGLELARMASKGILESYWDDKSNCMVFAHKDHFDPKITKKDSKKGTDNGKKDI